MESVEKRFVWDDFQEKIVPLSGLEQKDEKARKQGRKLSVIHKCEAYCPHSYLILSFRDILNPSEKIKFEKYFLRKVLPSETDVILLQDVKDLVMYLLSTPISLEFMNFFHQPIVNRLLRALILYFQCYLEVWEAVLKKCAVLGSKSGADERWRRKADDLGLLRCIVAREYCELLLEYVKSSNESDLRLFEPLIAVGHRVIWIALRRKHFSVIEVELQRLFRSDWFNTADRQSAYEMSKGLREDELEILHGRKSRQRKLLQNSPLCRQLLREFCDFRALSIGSTDFQSEDPKIKYLQSALLANEENFSELGVTVGILGHFRQNFNIMLAPIDDEKVMIGESPGDTLTPSESSLQIAITRNS